jgi:hypothetical protein
LPSFVDAKKLTKVLTASDPHLPNVEGDRKLPTMKRLSGVVVFKKKMCTEQLQNIV